MAKVEPPVILIDSREQRPYEFPGAKVVGLKSGDYSLLGFEDRIAIERKSLQDAFSSVGQGRKRFERELERLSQLEYAAIVLEANLEDFLTPPAYTRMNPKAVINSLIAWSIRYRVFVFFAGSRQLGRTLTRRLLEKFWTHQKEAQDAD